MAEESKETPGQASAAGALLEIDHPHGGLRYLVHVFDLQEGGIAWVDSGWTDPLASGHVCHLLMGSVTTSRHGWRLHSDADGPITLRRSRRESRPEGERALARDSLQQAFSLDLLAP